MVQWVYAPVRTRKVEGSNLAAPNFLFEQISSRKSEQKKKTSLSLSHRIGAVADGEEEKTWKTEASFEVSILSV